MTPKKVNTLLAVCGGCMFAFWGLGYFVDEAFFALGFLSLVFALPLLFMAKCPKCGKGLRPSSSRASTSFRCKACKQTFR